MSRKPRVLLIDHNLIVCQWVEAILAPEVDAVAHHGGAGAVAAMRQVEPDLILVEVAPPNYDGKELVQQLKCTGNDSIPILLYDYRTPEELTAKSEAWGADGWLEKTGDGPAFRGKIEELLADRAQAATTPAAPSGAEVQSVIEAARAKVAASIVSQATRTAEQRTKRILVVGDDCLDTFERRTFNRPDLEAAVVRSGARALDVLGLSRVNLVVLGPKPEDMSVEELCRAIRKDPERRNVSILYVAPRFVTQPAQRLQEAGANLILERPIAATEFAQAIATLTNVAIRRSVRVIVRMRVEARDGSVSGVGFSHNLSASGILVETADDLAIGATRVLRFFVPGSKEEIETTAEVVRLHGRIHGGSAFGMRFVDIQTPQRDIIERFVDSQRSA